MTNHNLCCFFFLSVQLSFPTSFSSFHKGNNLIIFIQGAKNVTFFCPPVKWLMKFYQHSIDLLSLLAGEQIYQPLAYFSSIWLVDGANSVPWLQMGNLLFSVIPRHTLLLLPDGFWSICVHVRRAGCNFHHFYMFPQSLLAPPRWWEQGIHPRPGVEER